MVKASSFDWISKFRTRKLLLDSTWTPSIDNVTIWNGVYFLLTTNHVLLRVRLALTWRFWCLWTEIVILRAINDTVNKWKIARETWRGKEKSGKSSWSVSVAFSAYFVCYATSHISFAVLCVYLLASFTIIICAPVHDPFWSRFSLSFHFLFCLCGSSTSLLSTCFTYMYISEYLEWSVHVILRR